MKVVVELDFGPVNDAQREDQVYTEANEIARLYVGRPGTRASSVAVVRTQEDRRP